MKKRYASMEEIASTAGRREGIHATLKATMAAWAGSVALVLLFVASLAYVAFGGTLALEASPLADPETATAVVAAKMADVGGALRKENESPRSGNEEQ